eukprot:1196056-Amphidinium_carterae.1
MSRKWPWRLKLRRRLPQRQLHPNNGQVTALEHYRRPASVHHPYHRQYQAGQRGWNRACG